MMIRTDFLLFRFWADFGVGKLVRASISFVDDVSEGGMVCARVGGLVSL